MENLKYVPGGQIVDWMPGGRLLTRAQRSYGELYASKLSDIMLEIMRRNDMKADGIRVDRVERENFGSRIRVYLHGEEQAFIYLEKANGERRTHYKVYTPDQIAIRRHMGIVD